MKLTSLVPATLVACCEFLFSCGTARALEISGEWEFTGKFLNDVTYARLNLKMDGQKVSGKMNELNLEGTIAGNAGGQIEPRPVESRFGKVG